MGKKEEEVTRVVLDTNVLVSALLFRGEVSKIADLWKAGMIVPVLSRETFAEFRAVLEYPKFRLTAAEIRSIIEEEVLPFFEVVDATEEVKGPCRDPDDDKFLACAVSASADIVVSGDRALCELKKHKAIRIISAADLLGMFSRPDG